MLGLARRGSIQRRRRGAFQPRPQPSPSTAPRAPSLEPLPGVQRGRASERASARLGGRQGPAGLPRPRKGLPSAARKRTLQPSERRGVSPGPAGQAASVGAPGGGGAARSVWFPRGRSGDRPASAADGPADWARQAKRRREGGKAGGRERTEQRGKGGAAAAAGGGGAGGSGGSSEVAPAGKPGEKRDAGEGGAASSSAGDAAGDLEAGRQDAGAPDSDTDSAKLSAYEKKRLKNITENANFFASLKLFESAARLRKMAIKEKVQGVGRVKSPKAETKTSCRRSMRLQRMDPLGAPLPEAEPLPEASVEEEPRLPPGPQEMIATLQEPETDAFLNTWAKISQEEKLQKIACSLQSYKTRLRGMALREEDVAKVVKGRIYSVAVHPSESRTLVAAGDKSGQVGLWDLDCSLGCGIYAFVPHCQPVSCLHFSPSNPAHLLSLSHDGTLRRGDVTRRVFDEIYRNESDSLSSFDFFADDGSTLIVGMWDGKVAVVDQRTPVPSPELSVDLNSKTRTVHVHPVSRHFFMTAGERNVGIYDVRHLKSRAQPVLPLTGHGKSVASAYFSPVTGNRVVTTCADDKLRSAAEAAQRPLLVLQCGSGVSPLSPTQALVWTATVCDDGSGVSNWLISYWVFGTKCLSSVAPTLTTTRHNNNTGRWLTRFRAVWDPKRDDCFVVGSMMRPREIQVFHATGELLHSFSSEDHLGSVCSINCWHPTRYVVAGGNSSGRVHVFREATAAAEPSGIESELS